MPRTKLSAAVKKRRGILNVTRDSEPPVPAGFPQRASILREDAEPIWEELRDILEPTGMTAQIDSFAVALLANAIADYRLYDEMVCQTGPLATSSKGAVSQHPVVGLRNKALEAVRKLAVQFGMTPSARSGLKRSTPESHDPLAMLIVA